MPLFSPNEGEVVLLQYMVNLASSNNPILRLYTNDINTLVSPNSGITNSQFTEASAAGYTAMVLAGSLWTTTLSGGVATAVYSAQTFSFTTAASVYGYYVTNNGGTKCLWTEKFSGAPFTLPSSGGQISIAPRVALS